MKTRYKVQALAIALLPGLLLFACGGGGGHSDGPTSPGTSDIRLASADVRIDGQSVNGATIAPGSGSATLLCATLMDPADHDRMQRVEVDYPMHGSMGMMGRQGTVTCWDDGTHGDPVAGDGTYCYMDVDGHVGPHSSDCPRGDYTYGFHGTDMQGRQTNEIRCQVRVQ